MAELSQFKAEFFKALAHPLRIRILDELRRGEIGVNDLCARLEAEQSTLSQQLAILRNRNIVVGRKDGQSVLYSVRDQEVFRLPMADVQAIAKVPNPPPVPPGSEPEAFI